jgi:Fe-S-cluster containining protein
MDLEEKVEAVSAVFRKLDEEIAVFQKWSGLHCSWGCGKCCFKPDIEASVLEFLPFAHDLYKKGEAFEWLDRLNINTSPVCLILSPTQQGAGMCSVYTHRGLICRLFGYSARTNKYGKKELVTCQVIKTEQEQAYKKSIEVIEQTGEVPVLSQFYMQLHAIDFELAREFFPINEAIKRAIELILHYYAYRS